MEHQRSLTGARWVLPAALPLVLIGSAIPAPGAIGHGGNERQEQQQTAEQESEETEDQPVALRFADQVVVSASRVEQEIVNAPAAVTVIGAEQLEAQPGADYSQLLRQAPGVNVSRMTSTSYTVTSRSSSVTGARHQLVLVDGRPVQQEYGSVAWSMLSTDLDSLERIEVVNGPASAVWGANAMTGVINLISRAPRDTPGTTLDLRFGTFDRNVSGNPMDAGNTFSGALTHAQAVSDTFAYRFSVSFSRSDAFARPFGEIWIEQQSAMFGDSVVMTENYRHWWAYIPHFIHVPFYVYAYPFGELLSLSLYHAYQRQGAPFVEQYRGMLAAGGSEAPAQLMRRADIDTADPAFWHGGLDIIHDMVQEAKALAKA